MGRYLAIYQVLKKATEKALAGGESHCILSEIAALAVDGAVECYSCDGPLHGEHPETGFADIEPIECDACRHRIHDRLDDPGWSAGCAFLCGASQYNGGDCGRRFCKACAYARM